MYNSIFKKTHTFTLNLHITCNGCECCSIHQFAIVKSWYFHVVQFPH